MSLKVTPSFKANTSSSLVTVFAIWNRKPQVAVPGNILTSTIRPLVHSMKKKEFSS